MWRFIHTGKRSPAENMAIDEAMLTAHREGLTPPTVRFYGWEPAALSIGYFQRAEQEVDLPALRAAGIGFVRRATGGRAVLHDCELTYSIVVSEDYPGIPASVTEAYRVLSAGLLIGFRKLGLNAVMSGAGGMTAVRAVAAEPGAATGPAAAEPAIKPTASDEAANAATLRVDAAAAANAPASGPPSPAASAASGNEAAQAMSTAACFDAPSKYELVVEGRKIAGSAQMRSRGVILQHGSILLELDADKLFGVLRFADAEEKKRMRRIFERKAVAVNSILRSKGLPPAALPDLEAAFRHGFQTALDTGLAPGELTAYELELAARLAAEKYGAESWNLRR